MARILGIETSCDETGVAVYDTRHGLLAHVLHSQIEKHAAYGGVVPELASRDHLAKLAPLVDQALAEAQSETTLNHEISNEIQRRRTGRQARHRA